MTLALLFWILMLLWIVLGAFRDWPAAPSGPISWAPFGGSLLLFILLLILGWHAFGTPIKT